MSAPRRSAALPGVSPALPGNLVYREAFIAADEERELLQVIATLPLVEAKYKGYTAHRRTLSWGAGYDFDRNALTPAPAFPAFLVPLRRRIADWTGVDAERFEHALVTEYRPGTALGWHRDVPQFDVVVGVSLASACRMRFRPYPPPADARRAAVAVELAPRSAYVLRDAIRWAWQHSIPPTPALRYSITLRTFRAGSGAQWQPEGTAAPR
jgi:alkylated DNA repair dioxygenase AlkB